MSMKIAGQENKKLLKKNNEKQAKLLQPPGEKKAKSGKRAKQEAALARQIDNLR